MAQPSKQIADRYRLQLSEEWQSWFDEDVHRLQPAGAFQSAVSPERLLAACPAEIWPGFMLPDTLPIVGNEYGDWICVRVMPDGQLGELLHWYHGGGDWVPVGYHLAEALLHDTVDRFRPLGRQMLRGASETIVPHARSRALAAFSDPILRTWFVQGLGSQPEAGDGVAGALDSLERLLQSGEYVGGLRLLLDRQWSVDAVACDLIEQALQAPIEPLVNPRIAESMEINWVPDYVRWLFDTQTVPDDSRRAIRQLVNWPEHHWPQQQWSLAAELAAQVLARRDDLGWAFDIVGYHARRRGERSKAAEIYFQGRFASAFSDQAVRMRTHWFEARFGKFSVAQLAGLVDHLSPQQREDDYLTMIWTSPEKLMLSRVRDYWCRQGTARKAAADFAEAYTFFYRAGWDLGVPRLSEYQSVLEELIACAESAGWHARAAIAETHLACLLARQA